MSARSEEETHGFSDLPGWMQGLIASVTLVYAAWLWLPAWGFVLVWTGLAAVAAAAAYLFVQRHDDPVEAFTAALGAVATLPERAEPAGEAETATGRGGTVEQADADDREEAVEKVDRLSSYQKSKLKDAVGMEREVTGCGTKRSLHVHHITPRSDGGGNELSNLIVVCRNHHADCDNGAFNRTQQRQMTRGSRFVKDGIQDCWRESVG